MKKFGLLLLVLAGLAFAGFAEITDNVNLEWSENDFQAVDLAIGNIDSDPQQEIVVVGAAGSGWEEMGLAVFELSSGIITFEDSMYLTPSAPVDSIHPTSVILCDVDGDGTKDIVAGGYNQIGISTERGFVYTYTYNGIISAQESYDGPTLVQFEALGAKQGAGGKCNIHAVGSKNIPGNRQAYTAILNTDSGTLDISQETLKSWLSDSSEYGIDFFDNGTVVTAGAAESGWTSTEHVSVTKNPGNVTSLFGSTMTNREATSVKVGNVTGTGDEEIIVGVDSRSILDDYAKVMLLDKDLNELDSDIIYQDNVTLMHNSHVNDVDACDVDNDGADEIFVAVDHYSGNDYGVLVGYNAIESMATVSLLETSEYHAVESGYETSLQAIDCHNSDMDTRHEVVGVINLANSTSSDYKIKIVILEEEPQVPVISVVNPSAGEAVSGEYTIVINVTDDSAPEDLMVQYRVLAPNQTSYYQAMNHLGYTFYEDVNFSAFDNGPYTLQFKAVDEEGNTVTESVGFVVDNEVLTINMLHPPEDSSIKPGMELLFSSSHPLTSFVYSVDGGANNTLSAPYVIETDSWDDGVKRIRVWAESVSGKKFNGLFRVIIDGTPPVITIYPTSPSIYPGNEITLAKCHSANECAALASPQYEPVIIIHEFGELKQLFVMYFNVSIDYTNSPVFTTIDTGDWNTGTIPVRVVARDVAGNPATTEIFPINVLPSDMPEPEEPPPDTETAEEMEDEALNLIEDAEKEISDAQSEGKDTGKAEKALETAKRLFSLGKYGQAKEAAEDAMAFAADAILPETVPEPEEPEVPEEKPEKPPKKPPEEFSEEEQAVFDYTMLIWGVLVIAVVIAAYYILSNKPKKFTPPKKEPVKPMRPPEESIKPARPKKKRKKKNK